MIFTIVEWRYENLMEEEEDDFIFSQWNGFDLRFKIHWSRKERHLGMPSALLLISLPSIIFPYSILIFDYFHCGLMGRDHFTRYFSYLAAQPAQGL